MGLTDTEPLSWVRGNKNGLCWAVQCVSMDTGKVSPLVSGDGQKETAVPSGLGCCLRAIYYCAMLLRLE